MGRGRKGPGKFPHRGANHNKTKPIAKYPQKEPPKNNDKLPPKSIEQTKSIEQIKMAPMASIEGRSKSLSKSDLKPMRGTVACDAAKVEKVKEGL